MFTCEKLRDNITSIVDSTGVRAFLIEGSEKAALIDTCCGIGNLKELVESMTTLPVIVLCTHGHADHAGGTYGFEDVYLNEADWELANARTTLDKRSGFTDPNGNKFPPEDYIPQRDDNYHNVVTGQTFDLGNITIEAIAVPGHTRGSMGFLIKEIRTLILSDACNPFTFMFLNESTELRTLMNSLNDLLERENEFDTVWISHGNVNFPKSGITDVLDVCEDILARKDDAIPFTFHGREAFIAKAVGEANARLDGKAGNVVYSLDKL